MTAPSVRWGFGAAIGAAAGIAAAAILTAAVAAVALNVYAERGAAAQAEAHRYELELRQWAEAQPGPIRAAWTKLVDRIKGGTTNGQDS